MEKIQNTDEQLNWWGRLLQNQGATIVAIIFMCGGLYAKIGVMEENLQEMKQELKLVRELDKANEALKIRVDNLEQWRRDSSK